VVFKNHITSQELEEEDLEVGVGTGEGETTSRV
jgi:hypothetical protein